MVFTIGNLPLSANFKLYYWLEEECSIVNKDYSKFKLLLPSCYFAFKFIAKHQHLSLGYRLPFINPRNSEED
jgi:hypothetical protein